ncbi:heme-dependent oxidative N-demethylase subunit alpha family protein [Chryseosolibacter indicus]|uniref:DUF3445 domain-containing protein n=1 Tax=Chryseosolibacter indicus TaxID=2782351 RepID=A0ABS5VMZ1_9BACT|nr:heme-dependent oxidative N-demethylase subunit alpha family protein [Chryseosolibacter indicus]MBT1702215.1 DUF3445 domain-containing protein [Chryseosolibacter indicus]
MKYLPFILGTYSTAPGLTLMNKATPGKDQLVFHIDETYKEYLNNKVMCRKEDIRKYYLEHALATSTTALINRYILHQLVKEYPEQFIFENDDNNYSLVNRTTEEKIQWSDDWTSVEGNLYLSLFDALCCQLQEDVAVFQIDDNEKDYLTAIHLCAPNHWSPAAKIGKPFDQIHEPVPNMERVTSHYFKMLSSIINSRGPFTRFAWGIATDTRLNHHPEPPPHTDAAIWNGRQTNNTNQLFFIRTERQNLIGFPEVNTFLFTIRTYFYEVDILTDKEKSALLTAVNSMSAETLRYKGLDKTFHSLKSKLLS